MELTQLKYFKVVAKLQHITNAAKILHIAQPALTKSMKKLENELQVPLFKPKGRNIELTEYGEYLYESIINPLEIIEKIPEQLNNMSKNKKSSISINLLSASTIVTEAIIEYKKIHVDINFLVVQNKSLQNADIVIDTLSNNEKPINSDNCSVLEEEICIAVPNSSKLYNQDEISLKMLKDESFVCLAGNKKFRNICDEICKKSGFLPNIVFESDNIDTVKNLIRISNNIGFWPKYTWKSPGKDIKLLSISNSLAKRKIKIIYQNNENNKTAKDFYKYLLQYINKNIKNNK